MSTETAPPHTTSHQHPGLRRELVTNAVNAKTLPGREILAEVVLTERELRIEVAERE